MKVFALLERHPSKNCIAIFAEDPGLNAYFCFAEMNIIDWVLRNFPAQNSKDDVYERFCEAYTSTL